MTPRARRVGAIGIALVTVAVVAVLVARRRPPPVRTTALGRVVTGEIMAPPNTRVRVEVINATRTSGLARQATRLLRDRGFDVVTYGTSGVTQDTTVVLDRSSHPDWARRVGQALGGARVEARPDTSRYVDVTVVLGATWRPPSQPFRP